MTDEKIIFSVADDTLFNASPEPEVPEPEYDEPSDDFIKKPTRPRGAIAYEKKVSELINTGMRAALGHEQTLADAAALIMYGPTLAEKVGNLAATDPRIARGIDFITDGTENPYASVAIAAMPLILQVIRNHEPQAEVSSGRTGFRIPFTQKHIKLKFKIKLGRLRQLTNDPDAFTSWVLDRPDIQAALAKQGINVASTGGN